MNKPIKKRLGDIVHFKRGYDLPSYNRIDGPYPVVSSSGISGYHAEYKVEGEGLITGRYGTLGEVYYINGKYWPHNTALYVTDFKGNYPKYVYYLMKCLGNLKTSDKSTVPGINRNDLHEIIIPYITPEFQKPIAAVLSVLDAKIELNTRINAELEALAKMLYDYWFVQFDFPNAHGQPYKSSGGQMVWNAALKREIPAGWEVGKINSKIKIGSGYPFDSGDYKEEGKYKIITIKNVQEGQLSTAKVDKIDYVPKNLPSFCMLNLGDVLISLTGNVGRMCFVSEDNLLLNQRVGKLIADNDFINYGYLFFTRPESQKRLERLAGGSSQSNLSPIDAVKDLMCILDGKILKKFTQIINPIFTLLIQNNRENQTLAALRDWLLPLLLNGQVTVG